MKINRFVFVCGAALAFFAVLIGAFGAHALETTLLENDRLGTFDTANFYHFFHALVLLVISLIKPPKLLQRLLIYASLSLLVGVIIFSGSLYVLSLKNMTWLGAITPIGGVCFLIGWGLLVRLGLRWPSEG